MSDEKLHFGLAPLRSVYRCATNILDLNLDTMLRVYDYLAELTDQVRLACTGPKFREAYKIWARTHRHTLNVEDLETMRLPEMINFFTLAGPFIKVLLVDCAWNDKESLLVEFIAEFCKNLEEIYYTNVTDDFHYGAIMSRMRHLKRITIHCEDAEDVLSFDLQGNRGLEYFELVNGCYTGKHLCGFPKLQTLVLRECLLWNSGEFGIPLKSLRILNLDDCCFEVMNESLYQKIADCCLNLEELHFSGCDSHFEVIAQLPKLKRCTLKTWVTSNELNIGFLNTLAEQRGNRLTHLHLSGQFEITNEHARALGLLHSLEELRWSNNDNLEDDHFKFFNDLGLLECFGLCSCDCVTDVGLMRLLRKCAQLRLMDLKECDQITNEFVLNAIGCLAKPTPCRHLVINVLGTKIKEGLLTSMAYLAPLNNVKLNFIRA
ncbi:uncharacterized protein LOC117582095 [Drosophila guanche]|uniref:Blast:F-box/LRR-repeat protein 7 n=1 Tax=Drosophila guanche TaxID=7266 RepID=A0A3B0JFZ8_DROGU|nr:uncharacterized protein LOC117582095 [Drosophila guanche]SPP79623.1 blast:F-box/LRR-repeat protein 7 [Drosophila guanche]